MRPKHIIELLDAIVEQGNHTPVFIWGPPGVGKSSIIKYVAERHAISFKDIRMSLLDPTDLRGIPVPRDGQAVWLPPSFLPNLQRDGEQGILFLDELNVAAPLVQASGYQLVLDRRVGEYELPAKWLIIAAGNRQGDRAVVHRMPSALANRFYPHIEFEVNVEDWTEWAIKHRIATEVIGFIQFRSDLLFQFDPTRDDRAFPTPRTWAAISHHLRLPRHLLSETIAGTVGQGAAAEFLAYLDVYRDLPDIKAILAGGDEMPPANRKDIRYATITSLATQAEDRHVDHLVAYSMNYPAEFAVLLVKLLQREHDKALENSKTFVSTWIRKYKDVLI